ncbi:hypothetical protein ATY41_04390 [Leifsonia xyli subsp. xyli]|uniref:Uncharacterized protein n=1 Tax=Leifsonia xyli subsp. xyli TaxID=59736 RepID=A0A1E2SJ18_LEIXY|nr:hypothetical protein [Leifsonia xyli]ODA89721.1 hypothetical protein ATY41_04390 [Leifsonia xyli subsp. xyli]
MSTHLTAQTTSTAEPAVTDEEHGGLVRSLSASLPTAVGNLLATLVVLVTLAFAVWSLIATWSGYPDSALPLFQTSVAGIVVALNALYARGTFSYVITLIGAILWLWVSITPSAPFWQVVMQAATITVMLAGVVFSTVAVALSTKPRF